MRGMLALAYTGLLLLVQPETVAAVLGPGSSAWASDGPLCLQSCKDSLWQVPFGDAPAGTVEPKKMCLSRLELRSTYLCLRLYCLPEAADAAYAELFETCLKETSMNIPPMDSVAGYTREQIGAMERVHQGDTFLPGTSVNELVIPAQALFTAWYTTLVSTAAWYRRISLTIHRTHINM